MTDADMMAVEIVCDDGVMLGGHLWPRAGGTGCGRVLINAATGVLARYYHPYARFLAQRGFTVLTYDYRGIGRSRPTRLRGFDCRWADWGERDFAAALDFLRARAPDGPMMVVGHSIGGFLPGLARNAPLIDRMLTVGAQYAYWRDYAAAQRICLFLKWHVAMPVLTALYGYFPGRKLGWLEDLPAGVAKDWSFRRARMEFSHPPAARGEVLQRFAAVTADILAIAVTDDELATTSAIRRALRYYKNAASTEVALSPGDLGSDKIGHFSLFHERHAADFWLDTLIWLRDGINPWPDKPFGHATRKVEHEIFESRCHIDTRA
ncbi:alpha/beta fold hydrolase [Pararhizobium sp. A13]|uniref:alpha/beta hydrolase family protein n=1 Tax=Pararhizobium sp. A13 TaxID=3133975 RepID=UPI00324E7A60